jgi:nitroreductase
MSQLDRPPPPDAGACSSCSADEVVRSRLAVDIAWVFERRSVAVKRLGDPGPTSDELRSILRAALTAPDHGALRPWRLIRCTRESRPQLAELCLKGKLKRHPDSTAIQIEREREKALRPPVLLALIAWPKPGHEKVPEAEQVASAGAALQSIRIAAHGLGFGAIMLSGGRCSDPEIRDALGVTATEVILGFISIGSIVEEPKLARRPDQSEVVFDFDGGRIGPFDFSTE